MSAEASVWRRYFPTNHFPLVPGDGIQASDGVMLLFPAIGAKSLSFCDPVADVGAVQFDIVPIGACESKEWVELEFDLRTVLAPAYPCDDLNFTSRAAFDIPAFDARVWQQTWDSPDAPYGPLGTESVTSTIRAGLGVFHYKAAWKCDPAAPYRFAVTIALWVSVRIPSTRIRMIRNGGWP